MLEVKQAGPLALIQDAGRFGVSHLGVTQGGAADWIAFYWANWLLGNPLNSAALEIVMGGGLTLKAHGEITLALTGADLAATVDGQPLAPNASFTLRSGQQLVFQQPRHGLRAYLAFPGAQRTRGTGQSRLHRARATGRPQRRRTATQGGRAFNLAGQRPFLAHAA